MSGASTLGDLLEETSRVLADAGLESPRREARALIAAFLPLGSAALYDRSRPIESSLLPTLRAARARRAEREPLARILGSREFWSLDFGLTAEILVPRPDSETLVEAALTRLPDLRAPYRILDLGTGSGCLLLAILSERPRAQGLGVDLSEAALRQAACNAEALGLAPMAGFALGDWAAGLAGPFDLIVSNPPYIERTSLSGLEPEVALYDPRLALDGGEDGLEAYRQIVPQAAGLLERDGHLVLEFGQGQAQAVVQILRQVGLDDCDLCPDLSGSLRAVCARRPQ